MSTKFRYEIEGVEVHPFGEWSIDFERNEGQIFFRKKFRGDLTFQGDDYTLIMSYDPCTVLDFEIFCKGTSIFTGEFKTRYSFKIDEDSCVMIGTPDTVDEYSCIMNYYDREYDYTTFKLAMSGPPYASNNIDIYNTGGGLELNLPIVWSFQHHIYLMLSDADYLNCFLDTDIKSSFLWEDDFPNSDGYAANYGTNNYVTGATNWCDKVYVIDNQYIRNAAGGTACGNDGAVISFKMIEEWLRERFNAYWYVDQNGDFRIEHASFFLPGFAHSEFEPGIDLTVLLRSDRKTYAYRTSKYEYLTDKLYDQEVWQWQHYEGTEGGAAHDVNFEGVPIFYGALVDQKSNCVPGVFKEKISSTPQLFTDAEWLINLLNLGTPNPDELACDGFFMFDIYTTPTPDRVMIAAGELNGANVVNGHCSTANLMEYFFTWERIFLNGDMNTADVTVFDSEIPKRLQDEITFAYCCLNDFDPMKYITTELGDGKVQGVTFNKNSITVKLLHV